jgi:hypothetical protein
MAITVFTRVYCTIYKRPVPRYTDAKFDTNPEFDPVGNVFSIYTCHQEEMQLRSFMLHTAKDFKCVQVKLLK